MFQGPTGGGPELQHVVWRRTVSIRDGRVIQDLPITSHTSRNRMFCPIGFTGDVETTFWSYTDPVKRAAWNASMRPNVYNDDRSPTVQINDSVMIEYIVVSDNNLMKQISHVSQKSRNPSYTHSGEFKNASKITIERQSEKAILRALSMQEQVAIDQEGEYLESKPIRRRMMYRASRMSSTPSAPGHERSIRWLADTGCPIDLVGLNELSAGEQSLVKKTGRTHALQTANGTASTLGSIAADMQDIDEVIDAHVMQNTPSLISIGKRCMEQGYTFTWPAGELPVLQGPNGKEIVLDVLNNVPYLPASRCNFSSPVTNQYPDIPAVPAPSALSGDVIKEGTEDLPSAPEGHPGSPDLDPPASDPIEETIELEGHGPLRSAEDWKADALTLRHMMTHLPKNPFCSHCQRAKMENVRLFRKRGAAGHGAEDFAPPTRWFYEGYVTGASTARPTPSFSNISPLRGLMSCLS